MSEKNNVGEKNSKTTFAVLAGILAFGILASAFAGSFVISNAVAQTSNGEGKVVTSIDDIDCSKVRSVVHCVEGTTEDSTNTSRSSYAGTATVSTSGTAWTNVKPDKFSVTVGVETNGTTAEEAASNNADLVAAVIAAFKHLGIAEDEISTSQYNVYPVYSHSEPVNACRVMEGYPIPPECYVTGEVISYKASNSVTVALDVDRDIDAGKVIDTAIGAGANNVNGVYFFVSAERQDEIRESLIPNAIANARHRGEVAAEAVGMSISGIQSINLNDVYFPMFSKSFDAAGSLSTPILPGEQEVSMTINVVFFIASSQPAAQEEENTGAADNAIATARQFVLSKLPSLGIEIDDELDLHTDMLVHVSESEFHLDFSVLDVNGQSHDGRIEILDGEIIVATLDGQSIL